MRRIDRDWREQRIDRLGALAGGVVVKLRRIAVGVDDLFMWLMILSGIAITLLANTARDVMKVRADRLWEKTKER